MAQLQTQTQTQTQTLMSSIGPNELENYSITLGLETSCDETAVALYAVPNKNQNKDKSSSPKEYLLGHEIYSQINLHALYGGVVPELASRDHLKKLPLLLNKLLDKNKLSIKNISSIAVTTGPGLVGALMVGVSFAEGLALSLGVPCLGINHMEGHLLAPMLELEEENKLTYPFVALLVSGGHTQLVYAASFGVYKILGESLDDAVGEAFDKTAKLMGLPYPGGPALARIADLYDGLNSDFYPSFTMPMINRPGLDFSFSGLKTQVLLAYEKSAQTAQNKAAIAHAFQKTIVETLSIKITRAMNIYKSQGVKNLVLAGGVAANLALREKIRGLANLAENQWHVFYPCSAFCTDNAAMIAYVGAQRIKKIKNIKTTEPLSVRSRWSLEEI